jgi:hypothetical protein
MNFKDVTKRVPELTEAANLLAKGKITASQYDAMVARLKPVTPYSFVPAPATIEDAMKALTENKKPMFGKSKDMTAGEQADLRLDIPAYKDHGVWVNSIHRKDQPTVYGSTSSVKNATMIGSPDKALKVAQGGPKAPFAVIRGDWNPMSEEAAVAKAQEYLDHPEWKQVGYDPERHGYFYDRASMEPVHGAEEVIQIGPLVLAKKPTYGKKSEEKYSHGGVLHMADAGRVSRGITGALTKAKEMAQAKKASESKIADVLESQQAPMTRPQGTGLPLMPRDNGMYTLRDQKDLPRMVMVDKARAANKSPKYNERTQDLLDSPKARKKVDSLINKGKELNVQEWYGTEPLRQVAMDAGRTPEQFESLMAQLASASQRNPVDKQNQMGSYLYHLSETGQLPDNSLLLTNKLKKALKDDPSLAEGRTLVELPTGYGSLAQGDIFNRALMISQGKIGEALPPNKKLGTFYENLLGNLRPVTVDVNALRGPIIEQGDPRWLASKLVEKDDKGKVINSYKPREMYDSGEMSMREAKQRPGFWEAAPKGAEYAGFEELWQRGAKRHGVEPAEAQALGWYGSADVTALKTKPENYVDNLERLIKRTAEQTGKSPSEVMNDMVTGKGFLRKDGGSVSREESKEDMARFHKRFAMHKAIGGHVKKMAGGGKVSIFDAPAKRMAGGGKVSIFDAPVKRMSKGGSSDEPTTKEIAKALGELAVTQGKKEYESLKKPRAVTDIGNRGILAPALGLPVDMINMGLSGVDALTGLMGKPTRLSSEKPFAGSEHIKDLMNQYGVTSGEDRPMTETALSLFSPTGMIKGAQKTADLAKKAPEALNTVRGGLETASANAQRPFRSATLTMEGVAPDLGQKGGDKFKDLITQRMILGEGAPVSMERMGGRKTDKTLGQGLYENKAGEFETNPMVGVNIPRAGNLSTNKKLLSDIGTAGQELNQEMVAAHKFTPLLFGNQKDATAMMVRGANGVPLTQKQIIELAGELPGMIASHSPKSKGMFVAPFEGDALDYARVKEAASKVLGKNAQIKFGKADPVKDILYRGDYADMGARPPSAESIAMRDRLKKAEDRIVRQPSKSQRVSNTQPPSLTSTVR